MAPARAKSTTSKTKPEALEHTAAASKLAGKDKATILKTTQKDASRKRKAGDIGDEAEGRSADAGEQRKLPQLKQRTRTISARVLKEKYATLPVPCQDELAGVFQRAERPIVNTFRSERQRTEARQALEQLSRRLVSSVAKLPVPPAGKEFSLGFEKLINKTAAAESNLEPTIRQKAELQKEIERARLELEKEEKQLEQLKENAKAEERVRNEKSRKIPQFLRKEAAEHADTEFNIMERTHDEGEHYRIEDDREMGEILRQFERHLRGMKANATLLGHIPQHMTKVEGLVEEVLLCAEDQSVYEGVKIGS